METADKYFQSEVDDSNLEDIKRDLNEDNEIVAFEHKPEKEKVVVILNLEKLKVDLSYIH